MKINLILLLSIIIFGSCGLEDQSLEKSSNDQEVKLDTKDNLTKIIFQNEEIKSNRFVTNIEKGDIVIMEISGIKNIPIFSTYEKDVYVSYKERKCSYTNLFLGNCNHCLKSDCKLCLNKPGFKADQFCWWELKESICNAQFKKLREFKKKSIVFGDDSNLHQIKYQIGNKLYSIGKLISNSKASTFKFKITEEMIQSDNSLSLVIQDKFKDKIKTGFIGYKNCGYVSKKEFNSDVDDDYVHMTYPSDTTFKITLSKEISI